jgi:hypothetical protein
VIEGLDARFTTAHPELDDGLRAAFLAMTGRS